MCWGCSSEDKSAYPARTGPLVRAPASCKLCVVACTSHPSSRGVEARESGVLGHLQLHRGQPVLHKLLVPDEREGGREKRMDVLIR